MRWIFPFQKPEKGFKIESNQTIKNLSRWIEMLMKWGKLSILIRRMSKKLKMILKKSLLDKPKEMNKSTKSFTRKKRKSMNSLSSLSKRKLSMKKKSLKARTWLPNSWNTCRRTWLDRISFQIRAKSKTWRMTSSSNKIRWKMPPLLQQDWKYKRSKSKMTLTK